MGDLDLIVRHFPIGMKYINVYALGDIHVGSEQFDERAIKKKIDIIAADSHGLVCLCGDLGDYGLKNSKTNVYKATMSPQEQQEYIFRLFKPIVNQIVAAVPGNHEERITKEVGTCPLYDLCIRWGISDVYRETMAINKYRIGTHSSKAVSFYGLTTHGSTRNKHKKFISGFDGIDFAISGHTHTPEYSPHGKLRINRGADVVTHVPYKEIVVDGNLSLGGYSTKKEYEIAPPPELQYIELSFYRDGSREDRRTHRVINYHSIQI